MSWERCVAVRTQEVTFDSQLKSHTGEPFNFQATSLNCLCCCSSTFIVRTWLNRAGGAWRASGGRGRANTAKGRGAGPDERTWPTSKRDNAGPRCRRNRFVVVVFGPKGGVRKHRVKCGGPPPAQILGGRPAARAAKRTLSRRSRRGCGPGA